MAESLNIVNQVIYKIIKHKKPHTHKNTKYTNISPHNIIKYTNPGFWNKHNLKNSYNSMEDLIKHFKHWSEGDKIDSNWTYQSVESPKGEFGVSLISNNTNMPYRCKVRSPAYHNMHVLPQISKGHFLADLVALIGTIDVVFGEVDR